MSITIKFYYNIRNKSSKTGKIPFCIRVIHHRKKAEGKIIGYEISEEELKYWNPDTQKFSKSLDHLNYIISDIESRFRKYLLINEDNLSNISAHEIRDFVFLIQKCTSISIVK